MSRRLVLGFVLAALLSGALPFATSARLGARSEVQSLPGRQVTVRAGHTLKAPKPIPAPLPARGLNGQALAPTANIEVVYTGFGPDAQAAFEAAVAVWESLIVSPKVIHVTATWTPLGEDVLALSGPTNFYRLPGGDRFYPAALYEAICNCESLFVTEIDADFNSAFPLWYFGTDDNAPADKYDFYSVVLHELGHGLGFFSSFDVSGSFGGWGYWSGGVKYPVGFDLDEWSDATGGNLLTNTSVYPNNSTALKTQLTDDSVYFGGSNVMAVLGGSRARLYAPSVWEDGSSNSHFDEAAYPPGDQNALMTPYLDNGEVNHDPGPLTLALFRDIGWSLAGSTTAPGQPTAVAAVAGNAQAVVNWTAPSDGGSPITGYTATSLPEAKTCSTNGATLNCTVTGLTNGTPYTFTVTATNTVGTGPPSDQSKSVTPQAPAGPANDNFADATTIVGNSGAINGTNVDATNELGEPATCIVSNCWNFAGPEVTVWYSWTAPNDGTATFDTCSNPTYDTTLSVYTGSAYPLTKVTDSEDACGPSGIQSLLSFTATARMTYSIQVDGWQGRSGTFTLTWNLPVAPPAGSLSPAGNDFGSRQTGTSSAAFGFTLSNTGGSQLASIDISIVGADPGQFSVSSTTCGSTLAAGNNCTIDVIHAPTDVGSHSATLQVTSNDPNGADTASLAGVGTAPPGAPRGVAATPGNAQALVSWTDPESNGGSAITGYAVTSAPDAKACTTDGTTFSCTVTGLTNGTPYTFTVVATNGVGDGPPSAPSAAVTPTAPVVRKPDGRIRKGTGAYVGNNIYNTTAIGQAKTGAKARGSTIKFGILAQNDSTTTADSFKLLATGAASAMYTVTFFRGTTDITAMVVAGTYTTPLLAPGATYLITVKVKVNSTATRGSSTTRLVTITSVGDGTKQDAVTLTGKRL